MSDGNSIFQNFSARLSHFLNCGLDETSVSQMRLHQIRRILMAMFGMYIIGFPVGIIYFYIGGAYLGLSIFIPMLLGVFAVVVLWKWRAAKFAANLGTLAYYLMILSGTVVIKGIENPGYIWFYLTPLIAGLMCDLRSALIWTGVLILTGAAFWWCNIAGIPFGSFVQPQYWPVFQLIQVTVSPLAFAVIVTAFLLEKSSSESSLTTTIGQLEHEIAARRKAESVALKASAVKSRFLATMSHEIRTPLNGVLGMAQLLRDTGLNEEQRDFLDTIEMSGSTLLNVINEILDFSKMEAGKLVIEERPFDLYQLLRETVLLLMPRAEARKIDLLFSWSTELNRQYVGDAVRVRQVVLNLLTNAIKFTEEGLVKLTVEQQPNAANGFIIRVVDTGIGISQAAQSRIFNAFEQSDSSVTRRFGGTGLGLVICQRLIQQMGGDIGVESVEGEGSTFTVNLALPIVDDDRAVLIAGEFPIKIKRIILVGEKLWISEDLLSLLRQHNIEAECLLTLKEAVEFLDSLETANSKSLAMLVCHTWLSREVSEIEKALSRLRAHRCAPQFIAGVSTQSQRAGLAPQIKTLVDGFLIRPVSLDMLREILQTGQFQSAEKSAPVHSNQLLTSHPLPILIAEDNEVNQKVAGRMLEKLGYKVDIVENGIEAVEAVQHGEYTLILMDVQMPQMDGFEATRIIRGEKTEHVNKVPIIALTANAMEEDKQECLAAGMDDFLRKPLKRDELQRVIAKWQKLSAKRRALNQQNLSH